MSRLGSAAEASTAIETAEGSISESTAYAFERAQASIREFTGAFSAFGEFFLVGLGLERLGESVGNDGPGAA